MAWEMRGRVQTKGVDTLTRQTMCKVSWKMRLLGFEVVLVSSKEPRGCKDARRMEETIRCGVEWI